MTEAEVQRTSPPELSDIPDSVWERATMVYPVAKHAISLRMDEDVLVWFKAQGPRYQTRINAVLRSYMHAAERPTRRAVAPRARARSPVKYRAG